MKKLEIQKIILFIIELFVKVKYFVIYIKTIIGIVLIYCDISKFYSILKWKKDGKMICILAPLAAFYC